MLTIDCLGEMCPVPLMRLQKTLKETGKSGEILLVTDHSCVPKSIADFCRSKKLGFRADEVINGVWELHITPKAG